MKNLKKNALYILFVGPAVLAFCLFVVLPFAYSVRYSFFNWNGIDATYSFIGLQNYLRAFTDKLFLGTIGFTLKYTASIVIILNVFGLLLALALNMAFKGRSLLRTVFFVPNIMGLVIIGYLWNFIIMQFFPLLGSFTGLELFQKNWMAYPDTAFYALVLVTIWQGIGYYMIIYLTGLQSIPIELYESASIDGVTKFKGFYYITLPYLRPAITICIFLSIISGLKAFDLSYSLTSGGPFGTTQTIAFQIYLDAFDNNMMSYACAKSVLFSLAAALVSIVQVSLMRRKEVEL